MELLVNTEKILTLQNPQQQGAFFESKSVNFATG